MALSQSMRDFVPIKTLVSKVVRAVVWNTNRIKFITHSTVFWDNYGVVKITHNHKFPLLNPGYNYIVIKFHWFREKIYSGGCSVKKVYGKEQKANIFTKGLQGELLLHIKKLLCVC